MMHARVLSIVALFGSAALTVAQQPSAPAVPAGQTATLPQVKTTEATPGAATAQPGAQPAAAESQRLPKLRQLQFDRRPSAILKAWANLHKPAEATEKKSESGTPEKKDPIDEELTELQRDVTLGHWGAVQAYLVGLPEDEGKAGYQQLLQSLQSGARPGVPAVSPDGADFEGYEDMYLMQMRMQMSAPQPMNMQQFAEQHLFSINDIIGLASAAPRGLDKETITKLGGVFSRTLATTAAIEHAMTHFKEEASKPKGQTVLNRRQVAQLLAAGGQMTRIGEFLPDLETARKEKDHEALNLLSRLALALHAKEKKAVHLEKAWEVTQAILGSDDVARAEKDEALKRAVELAPRLREKLGQAWLDESFAKEPVRGIEILATLGGVVAQGLQSQPMNAQFRLKQLSLQKSATEALLKAAPERAAAWRETLTLLAANWLREAEHSRLYDRSSGMGPRMRRDRFGNIFFVADEDPTAGQMMPERQGVPQAIRVGDLLEARPGEKWSELIDEGIKPQIAGVTAQLYLKANDENKAFPFIEQLAKTHPDKTRDLVNEFIRVWTRNHDPNESRRNTNPYMFMYGFEMRAQSIPLTRSKQERNLKELSGWVKRIRAIPDIEPDEDLLAKAFTNCHSSAEVYRLEAIETVFGSMSALKPKTLAGLAQQMRTNLAGVWRKPAEQKKQQTNRKQKDIEVEVMRGYGVARGTIENAIKKFPEEWSLHLARAALLHDETNYRQEVAKSSDFSAMRQEALAGFQAAAKLYAKIVTNLSEEEETTQAFEQWFYASLGAVDLDHLDEEKLADLRQPALIRAAIQGLPGEVAARHMGKFANSLFVRMSAVKPAAKARYVRTGFKIVGEHKQAWEARKVFDYYSDLVSELKLEAVIDGSDQVGHGKPFGVKVSLRHTREIERESGGFGRYLQNQNQGRYFYWNYGRPLADYRDKFQTAATEALKEHFDVLSVTFQTENVNSRAAEPYGWRVTPYAYLLLKARGPQIDKLPAMRMDLDFLDTSGYVILPISSPAVPIDTSKAEQRPVQKLLLTQILDERQADQGKLILEVKVSGRGLIGELGDILDFKPEGFDIAETNDQGLSVAKFDENEPTEIVSERNWLLTLNAKSATEPATAFRFGKPKIQPTEMVYQRYVDADLASANEEVSLEKRYAGRDFRWVFAIFAGIFGIAIVLLVVYRLRRSEVVTDESVGLPEELTPFSVTGLLYRIERNGRLNDAQRAELQRTIQRLERHYFADEANGNGEVNLREVAETWVRQAR